VLSHFFRSHPALLGARRSRNQRLPRMLEARRAFRQRLVASDLRADSAKISRALWFVRFSGHAD
jgi:hypothetical protein